MIIRSILVIKIVMLVFVLLFASNLHGQVDPEWLKSWNQAIAMRPEKLSSSSRIASHEEPGIPLVIQGQIFKPSGNEPATHVLVHAYHRDHNGFDFGPNDNSFTTWRLQGWAITNSEGKFEYHTIRPAPDQLGREGGHIHFTTVSQDFGKQWAPKIHFLDDFSISQQEKKQSLAAGQFGWIKKVKVLDGIQHIDVKIKLKAKTDF